MLKYNSKTPKEILRFITKQIYKILAVIGGLTIITIATFLIVKANPDSVSDTFTDETKIATGTVKMNIATTTGQVTLAECYGPDSEWTKEADTIVRDISNLGDASSTINKDIYCDDHNCILWTDGVSLPSATTVCIATNSNVYGSILWSKTDRGSYQYGESGTALYGDQIGETHASGLKTGNNQIDKGGRTWLNRYYSDGTFPAMNACKSGGSGWRLPNALELDGIRDQDKGSAPYTRLPNIVSGDYWTSTDSGDASKAAPLDFSNGNFGPGQGTDYKHHNKYIRCIREH